MRKTTDDLRNPLAVIQVIASSLLDSTTDEKQANALRRALRNVDHAASLITDLVDVTESRVSGTIRVATREEDLCEIVRRTIEDLRDAHSSQRIQYTSSATSLRGHFDAVRIAQIVTNLVNNAVMHGDATHPVDVELVGSDDSVELVVRNQGPAIAADVLPTIFDPFKQGTSHVHPQSVRGLGLGLYIVDCLARGHGGSVSVTSSDAEGTAFTVRLPRAGAAMHEPALARTEPGTVLIVDDDPDVGEAIALLLEKRGYRTARAANGQLALDQLRAGLRPSLILLDLQMPVMDGQTFADECARDPELAAIPIVVVSSDTASAVRLDATRASAYLSKPVPFDRLLATIENLR